MPALSHSLALSPTLYSEHNPRDGRNCALVCTISDTQHKVRLAHTPRAPKHAHRGFEKKFKSAHPIEHTHADDRIKPSMATQTTQLVKTTYLDTLDGERKAHPLDLAPEDRECGICREHMNFPVMLHHSHYACKECAENWLDTSNTCPHCRRELFEEDRYMSARFPDLEDGVTITVSVNNDRENLQRQRTLYWHWKHGSTSAIRAAAAEKWFLISAARVTSLRNGHHTPPASDYASYGENDRRTTHRFSQGEVSMRSKHPVQAEQLLQALWNRNVWLAVDGNKCPPNKPTLACHPIAFRAFKLMLKVIQRLDGKRMSRADLASRLRLRYFGVQWGINIGKLPDGLTRFIRHTVEDICLMHAGADVFPKGWAVRIPCDDSDDDEPAGTRKGGRVGQFLQFGR